MSFFHLYSLSVPFQSINRGSTDDLLLLQIFSGIVWQTRDLILLSPRLIKRDLFVYRNDSLTI